MTWAQGKEHVETDQGLTAMGLYIHMKQWPGQDEFLIFWKAPVEDLGEAIPSLRVTVTPAWISNGDNEHPGAK